MSIAVRDMYSITSEDVDFVVQFVAKESGIVLDHAKTYLIDSRLADVARRLNLGGPSEVIKKLRTMPTPELQRQAVEAMTTNETSFFRDHSPFEALKTDIVPKLITQNAAKRSIRIWSAACSTGQEAYSIAMTLRESFPVLSTWKIEIVGTDINSQVLQRARWKIFPVGSQPRSACAIADQILHAI